MRSKHYAWGALLIVTAAMGWLAGAGSAHDNGDEGDAEVNEKAYATAADPSNRGVDGFFKTPPNGNLDEIEVTNPCVKGLNAGPYKDPIDDCADVYLKTAEPPVAEVEGRLGVGAMYWVDVITVPCKGDGKGAGPAKEPEVLRADVKDIDVKQVLTLTDAVSGRQATDATDAIENPMQVVYCSTPSSTKKGRVQFELSVKAGDYRWTITNKDTNVATPGTLTKANKWVDGKNELNPGQYRLEVKCDCDGQKITRTIDFVVFTAEIKYPHGNPSQPPKGNTWVDRDTAAANIGNEFTFSGGASPGVATVEIPCEAKVIPARVQKDVEHLLHWKVDDIPTSAPLKATWSDHVNGDRNTGKGLKTIATFTTANTGLPVENTAFGKRVVQLTTGEINDVPRTTSVEVFYPRGERNHAGGQAASPNWFHYWLQAKPASDVKSQATYVDEPLNDPRWPRAKFYLITPAMMRWQYNDPGPGSKTQILVGNRMPARDHLCEAVIASCCHCR